MCKCIQEGKQCLSCDVEFLRTVASMSEREVHQLMPYQIRSLVERWKSALSSSSLSYNNTQSPQ